MKLRNLAAAAAALASLNTAPGARAEAAATQVLTPQGMVSLTPGGTMEAARRDAATDRRIAALKATWAANHAGAAPQIAFPAPRILGGDVLSDTLEVGVPTSVPTIQFNFQTGAPGLSSAQFVFTSPNGNASLALTYYGGALIKKGPITMSGQTSLPYFTQPGTWTLTSAVIADTAGDFTKYDEAQLADIFLNPSLTMVNPGPVDATPPVVTKGKVLTPAVSLSSPAPQFLASLTASDDLSGVQYGFVIIQAPGASYGQTQQVTAPLAFKSGTIEVAAPLFAGSAPGIYGITGFQVCDVALNCFLTQSSADVQKLFGTTTFTVTK